jgi:hypothetical protein
MGNGTLISGVNVFDVDPLPSLRVNKAHEHIKTKIKDADPTYCQPKLSMPKIWV